MRLRTKDIPATRTKLMQMQGGTCLLCFIPLADNNPCLDHDHQTGRIRGVLCGNCNGIEGKMFNLARRAKRDRTPADFVASVLAYWEAAEMYPHDLWHPAHRTPDEKRLLRNKRARLKRKRLTSK
jgi:hypothetical protein